MYKTASRKMLHAHVVDRVNQSGVYIGLETDGDPLAAPAFMSDRQLADERAQLVAEKLRWEADLNSAKASNDQRQITGIGQNLQVLCARLSLINPEIKKRNVDKDDKVWREIRRLTKEKLGDEAFFELVEQAKQNVAGAAA